MASRAAAAPSGTPVPSDVTGSRSTTIKWNDTDTGLIISWLSERNGEGARHNLDDWNKGNNQHATEKMLHVTGLINKVGVDNRKASERSKVQLIYVAYDPRSKQYLINNRYG